MSSYITMDRTKRNINVPHSKLIRKATLSLEELICQSTYSLLKPRKSRGTT